MLAMRGETLLTDQDAAKRTGRRAVIAVIAALVPCLLCLLVLAVGYVRQQRQVAELQQELTLLRQRVEKEHNQNWRDELYIPFLEQRLIAAHEKGTPAEWRALVMQREDEK